MKAIFKKITKNGKPVGYIAAVSSRQIGWSKWNKKDKWNKNIGKEIAFGRAKSGWKDVRPTSVTKEYFKMVERAGRYFK